jgi:O-methyltransferase
MQLRRHLKALVWLLIGSPAQRRRVRQELARVSAAAFGDFPLSDDYKAWREDRQFLDDYRRLSPGNPYSQDRKWALREFVLSSNHLPGDLAECGCFEGASSYFIASASTHGSLCLFDSFQGISAPQPIDQSEKADVMPWSQGDLSSPMDTVRQNLHGFPIEIFPGWIPERFQEVANRHFRLVHIDVDLYEPTRQSIEFFFERLVAGGYIVMDDYGLQTCPGARKAADEFAESKGTRVLHLPTGQGILIKPAIQ